MSHADPKDQALAIAALRRHATEMNLKFMDDRDIEVFADDVQVDKDGSTSGARATLEHAAKHRSHLFSTTGTDKGRTTTPGEQRAGIGDPPDHKKSAMEMTDEEYRKASRESPIWRNVI